MQMVVMLCHIQMFALNELYEQLIWGHPKKVWHGRAKQAVVYFSNTFRFAFQQVFSPCGLSKLETWAGIIRMDSHKDINNAVDRGSKAGARM